MRMLVLMLVRVVMTGVIVIVRMFLRRFHGARGWLLFGGLGSRFSGLLRLLFSDCQWIAFRVLLIGKSKHLV